MGSEGDVSITPGPCHQASTNRIFIRPMRSLMHRKVPMLRMGMPPLERRAG
jgi:hypothetical protein